MTKWVPFTRLEYVIAGALLLILAVHVLRFRHAEQIRHWEEQFFEAIGLSGPLRFLVLVPLAGYVIYRRHRETAIDGQPAVRWQVWAVAVAGLIGAFAWAIQLTRG